MDRLDAMTAFVTVADLRGFAPAARRLRLSPSAVTRLVAGLEAQLGTRLLQRTTRKVTLTDPGTRYLARARRILAEVAEAESAVRDEQREPTGRLTVTAPAVFGRLQVAPLMCTYLARHPRVTAELILSDAFMDLVGEGIDLAVRIGPLTDSGLVARRVGHTRRVVVAAPDYLRRRGTPRSPAELTGHDLIQFTMLSATADWRFFTEGQTRTVTFAPSFITNSADAAIGHAKLGGGVAMVLGYQVAAAVAAGELVPVLVDHEPPPLPIQLVHTAGRHRTAALTAFVDLVVHTADWRFG